MMEKIIAASFAVCLCGSGAAGNQMLASRFGWNGVDDTKALQSAIDSGAEKVIIDRQRGDWVVRPLFIRRSNVEIVLADGVTVRAKKNEFKAIGDSLVKICGGASNVVLRGEGRARIVMNKADYLDRSRYAFSEWRMGIALVGCSHVTVKGLSVESSGGDGVYVNSVKNAILEDLVCRDHNRQGISVISVDGLVVRRCRFETTSGAAPMAGLDIEPNNERQCCRDVVFEHCSFSGNASSGVIFCLPNFTHRSDAISITLRDCEMTDNAHYGVSFTGCKSEKCAVKGTVLLERCVITGNGYKPLLIRSQPGAIRLKLKDCVLDARGVSEPAMRLDNCGLPVDMRNISFENVRVRIGKGKPYEFSGMAGVGLLGVDGAIDVERDGGPRETITAATLMARHVPRPELRTFDASEPDYRRLRPVVPAKKLSAPVSSPFFRYRQTFVQYVQGPGEYPVRLKLRMLGGTAPQARVKVLTPGADICEFTMNEAVKDYVIKADADRSNVYIFEVSVRHGGLAAFESSWPGSGALASRGINILCGRNLEFYFSHPGGVRGVQAKISPAGGEPAAARLIDPSGVCVAEQPYRDAGSVLKSPANAAAGLWKVVFPNVKDDCAFTLGGGAVPIVSFAADAVLSYD